MKATRICIVTNCQGSVFVKTRGICRYHYDVAQKAGELDDYPQVFPRGRETCTVEGCNMRHASLGLCSTHRARLLRTGTTDAPRRSADAFWDNVKKGDPDECWLWLGPLSTSGYGRVGRAYAHRVSCEMHHGAPPEGANVARHHCDNPPCVNPGHLAWGTQADNMADMVRRGRSKRKANA